MTLTSYIIQHPTLHRQFGAQFKPYQSVSGDDAKRVNEWCIKAAKKVAEEKGMPYEEMIHTINGKQLTESEILKLC